MKKTAFDDWCARAVSAVSWPPDREEIRRELLWHLEDSAEFFAESGMERAEAEARALEEMGDARQVGALLRRIHKPWLGALHFASNLLLAALVFFVILEIVMYGSGTWIGQELERVAALEPPTQAQLLDSFSYGRPEEYELVAEPEIAPAEFRCGDYSFAVTGAWLWHRADDDSYLLAFSMDFRSLRFWQGAPEGIYDFLCAVESGGKVHPPLGWPLHGDELNLLSNTGSTAVGSISGAVKVEADAQWVDMIYAHGEGFSFRLDWGGAA